MEVPSAINDSSNANKNDKKEKKKAKEQFLHNLWGAV